MMPLLNTAAWTVLCGNIGVFTQMRIFGNGKRQFFLFRKQYRWKWASSVQHMQATSNPLSWIVVSISFANLSLWYITPTVIAWWHGIYKRTMCWEFLSVVHVLDCFNQDSAATRKFFVLRWIIAETVGTLSWVTTKCPGPTVPINLSSTLPTSVKFRKRILCNFKLWFKTAPCCRRTVIHSVILKLKKKNVVPRNIRFHSFPSVRRLITLYFRVL